jgi:hypothetical protein
MSSSRYNLRPRNPPGKPVAPSKAKTPASTPKKGGATLSPVKPVASLKPKTKALAPTHPVATRYPIHSSFAKKSTGAHFLRAARRDALRVSSGKIGKPRNQFEKTARQARKDWREGTKQLQPVQTPYGSANLSKFPTGDPGPKVTTVKKNYKNSSVGHKYTELRDALIDPKLKGPGRKAREKEVAGELLEAIKTGAPPPNKKRKITDGEQSNAAAKFIAISHISEPERVHGSSKDVRASLRSVQKGKRSFSDAFSEDNGVPRFPLSKNPNAARRALGIGKFKKPHPPASFVADDSDYSDSSDDEAS